MSFNPLHLAAIAFALSSAIATAQTGGPTPQETTPPGAKTPPEQQAIDACKDKKEGDRVRFTDAKGKKRHYTCTMVDGTLAARPAIATPAHPPKKK